jgi:xylulokinase
VSDSPILAIDVGTSSVKAAVLDRATGEPLARPQKCDYPINRPVPDAAEVQPELLWDAITSAVRKVTADLPKGMPPISGIGFSVLTPALFLLNQRDEVLAPARIHLDRRSRPIARQAWFQYGEEYLHTVGNRPLPGGLSALSFAQLIHEQPELHTQIHHYLHVNGWLGLRLVGERYFDPANASFTGLFDTMTLRDWSPRWCEAFRVDPRWLPPVTCGRTTIGELRPSIAKEWGIPAKIPVKLGTADTSLAMLDAGLTDQDLLHVVGTTQVLGVIVHNPKPDARRLTRLLGVGNDYVYVAHNPIGGVALDWVHDLCFQEQSAEQFYGTTVLDAAKRSTCVQLDPPFLGGDRLEIEPRIASLTGLTLSADRMDILAAIITAMRDGHHTAMLAIERANDSGGRIFLTGGGASVVRRILTDYQDRELITFEEGSLRGVAKLFHDPSAGVAS